MKTLIRTQEVYPRLTSKSIIVLVLIPGTIEYPKAFGRTEYDACDGKKDFAGNNVFNNNNIEKGLTERFVH